MTNTKKLQGKMREKNLTILILSRKMGLSPTGLFNKIHNRREFLASEIFKMGEILGITDVEMRDIFYGESVELNSTSRESQNNKNED